MEFWVMTGLAIFWMMMAVFAAIWLIKDCKRSYEKVMEAINQDINA